MHRAKVFLDGVADGNLKNGRKQTHRRDTMKFTHLEQVIVFNVLNRVAGNLSFNAESGKFQENYEDWRMSLTEAEHAALISARAKLA